MLRWWCIRESGTNNLNTIMQRRTKLWLRCVRQGLAGGPRRPNQSGDGPTMSERSPSNVTVGDAQRTTPVTGCSSVAFKFTTFLHNLRINNFEILVWPTLLIIQSVLHALQSYLCRTFSFKCHSPPVHREFTPILS